MHLRSATKVGLALLVSLGAFLMVWYFLLGRGLRAHAYPLTVLFKDAQNITTGAEVRLAGVEIGAVDDIGLTPSHLARLHLLIRESAQIPRGSEFIVTSGGLIGEKYVSITPPDAPTTATIAHDSTLRGESTVQVEDLMEQASALASSSNEVIREARLALIDTRTAIRSISRLTQDPALERYVHATLQNVEAASRHADATAAQFQQLASSVQPGVRKTMAAVQQSADNVQQLTASLNGIVSGEDLRSDMGAALHNVRLATEHLNTLATNLDKLSGDQTLAADLKESAGNIRVATEQSAQAAQAINETVQKLTGRLRRARGSQPAGASGARAVPLAGNLDLLENVDPGHLRADVNAVVPVGAGGGFVYGGLRGLGDGNRLNLQIGRVVGGRWDARYGLYGGRLGVGIDHGLGRPDGWSIDAYDPNHLKVDLYGRKGVNDGTSFVFGIEDLLRRTTPTLGVRIRR